MFNQKNPRRPALMARTAATLCLALAALAPAASPAAPIDLADQPLLSTSGAPGNLILALSVEWPTASTPAYLSTAAYGSTTTYVGYFDPDKCYSYVVRTPAPDSYFTPVSVASGHACTSTSSNPLWSGNYLNWASTQTLDAFRWALTGGTRSQTGTLDGDTGSLTILEKTNHSGQGSRASTYPDKLLSAGVSGATPFNWASAKTRIWKGGAAMWITSTGATIGSDPPTFVDYNGENSYTGSPAPAATIYKVYVRVRVCDESIAPAVPLEANCKQYGSKYKPEGLMQQYATKLRYSVFGYLNDVEKRDGGVMRARMKYIGPNQPVPGAPSVANANAEWNASTGVMITNPDTTDAAATTADASAAGYSVAITNSGVMNYLNKFGKVITGDYKRYDPVSELYYSAQRYFRNLGNVGEYSSLAGAGSAATLTTWLDGFPAIKTWDDPVLYSCQKNFILGIGDVYTHSDTNLPGSTLNSAPAVEPAVPAAVTSDTSINVKTATDMVGTLEGIASLGSTRTGSGSGTKASYFIAGLAYDAHTKDIRADLPGSQTINTYWLDVMEGQTYLSKNQYWLAAKYGGFEVPTGFSTYAGSNSSSTLLDSSWWTTADLTPGVADKRPDNYFLANQADKMVDGLTKAFAKIIGENDGATTTAFSTPTAKVSSTNGASYAASYEPKTWSGVVTGSTLTFAANGTPTLTQVWDARALLEAATPAGRKIVTCCTSAGAALPFAVASLATLSPASNYASFASVPGVAAGSQSAANYVAYLRGDHGQEQGSGGVYRKRVYRLGDVSGSKANPVGAPSAPYFDLTNPGYSAFKRNKLGRKTVVYAGANDGMMHAFDGTLPGGVACATCGTELFAYMPSFTYGGSDASPATTGLASYGNPNFAHHFFVDATPQNFDVDFKNTAGASAASADWRTLLIGGLGKGGKGYYAIDVSDPTAWTTEAAIAGKVLWEFTDSRMGYSYGDPSVVKTTKYGWVVIFTSGYNNSDGKGYFFIVNPRTGVLLEAVATPDGSPTAPLNMAHHTAYVADYTNFTADAIYAGDLLGNVWRVDLTGSPASYPAPLKFATLTNGAGNAQPVTTRPLIEVDPNAKKRYVLIGTGRLLADSDTSSTQQQAFYAIIDGTAAAGAFYTAPSLPVGVSFPVTRGNLNANTDVLSGIGAAPANPMGWYIDLGPGGGGVAERINVNATANVGVIGIGVNRPDGTNPCVPGGSSRVLGLSFGSGKTVLDDGTGTLIADSTVTSGLVTDIGLVDAGGKIRLVAGDTSAGVSNINLGSSAALALKRLNWREVPTAD